MGESGVIFWASIVDLKILGPLNFDDGIKINA